MAGERIVLVWILGLMCWTQGRKVNIAREKHASTSLGHFESWTPDKAVDGNKNIHGRETTCFFGAGSPSEWTVDLGEEYQLYIIQIYLANPYENRIADSFIYLDKDISRICYTFPSFNHDNPTDVTCNRTGRYVTIKNPGDGGGDPQVDNIGICEVEIYGCTAGTYGIDCTDYCHCASPPCDRWTGVCSGDCAAGYRGNKCDTTCGDTTYGVNCKEKCVDRKCNTNTSSCDNVTGSCGTGCLPGWMGIDCISVCGDNFYGSSCSSFCAKRNCYGNSTCHHVTGSCDKGCEAGWEGIACMQVCDSEHYGRDCSWVCDNRHCEGNSTCNPITGECNGGCQKRWTGIDCTDCDNRHYGINCTSLCADRNCNGNSTCHHVTGSCDQGCEGKWRGVDCSQNNAPIAVSPPVYVIVGGVIGVVILVLVLVVVLIRRRRKANYHQRSKEVSAIQPRNEKGPNSYENAALDDESKKPTTGIVIGLVRLNGQAGDASKDFDSRSVDTLEEEEEDYDSPVHNIQHDEGRNYYNLDDIHRGHLIPVSQLAARVKEFEEKPELSEEEYQQLPDTFLHPYDESQKPGNKSKNRFKGYYPYNYNRVVLHDHDNGGKGDYINASYLDGYQRQKRYIAAQGPYKEVIVEDFWRMIWQKGCKAIVMVTGLTEGGKMKCLRYWPEKGSSTFRDVTVTMETQTKLADYTITKLVVQYGKESKKHHVTHFHFTSWPDHGVSDISCLLQYMWRINSTSGQQKQPIVVHCSAGIGRTGTYIAVESLVSQATTEGVVDVFSFVSNMRSQRKNMIQTKEQYLFIYQAVTAAVVEGDTSLDADVIRQIELGHMADVQMGKRTVQQHLKGMTSNPETSTSDNTTTVSSYTSRVGFFVVTSQPDKETFWNRIYNSDTRTVVTWDRADKSYLPSSDHSVSTSRLTASMRSSKVISDNVTLSTLHLQKKDDREGIILHHYNVTGSVRDPSVNMLIDSLLQWTRQPECESTMIVSHSVSESRLLILLVNITSRLQDDGKVDVISNMRRLQSLLGGPRFTVDDVRLCLEFSKRRLDSLGTYANLSEV